MYIRNGNKTIANFEAEVWKEKDAVIESSVVLTMLELFKDTFLQEGYSIEEFDGQYFLKTPSDFLPLKDFAGNTKDAEKNVGRLFYEYLCSLSKMEDPFEFVLADYDNHEELISFKLEVNNENNFYYNIIINRLEKKLKKYNINTRYMYPKLDSDVYAYFEITSKYGENEFYKLAKVEGTNVEDMYEGLGGLVSLLDFLVMLNKKSVP